MPSKTSVDSGFREEKRMPARRMLRANEAAERYSVGESSLWRWAREGKLHPVRHGGRLTLWSVDELEAYFGGVRPANDLETYFKEVREGSHDQP